MADGEKNAGAPPAAAGRESGICGVQAKLDLLERMFAGRRDDPPMRELYRLAVKCAREKWINA
jgi:hypothetical protein